MSSSVVKIIVGNKVDKVRPNPSFPCRFTPLPPPQEYSRQVSTAEGQAFATRMGALFVEASAKTAVGVEDAFRDVVARIIDTPELWQAAPRAGAGAGKASARRDPGNDDMPGSIDLHQEQDEAEGGGCAC